MHGWSGQDEEYDALNPSTDQPVHLPTIHDILCNMRSAEFLAYSAPHGYQAKVYRTGMCTVESCMTYDSFFFFFFPHETQHRTFYVANQQNHIVRGPCRYGIRYGLINKAMPLSCNPQPPFLEGNYRFMQKQMVHGFPPARSTCGGSKDRRTNSNNQRTWHLVM